MFKPACVAAVAALFACSGLALAQVRPEQLVGLLRGAVTGVSPHDPGTFLLAIGSRRHGKLLFHAPRGRDVALSQAQACAFAAIF